tara:strand:+ start:802 stop:2544 length:1743 start_codon:yes stop_codon:yes gene_type:complete
MADKEYSIKFTVDGLTGQVKNVEEFTDAMEGAKKATKEAGEEATIFGDIKGKMSGLLAPIKKVIMSMRTLSGAIAATGIGLLVVALGTLVAYFKNSEEGSKKLAIAMETLSLLFGELTSFASDIGEKLVNAFKDPQQAIKDFGQLIVDNVIERFKSLLEVVGFVGSAFVNLFSGEFEAALADIKSAGTEMVDVFTGVDNSLEIIVETGTEVFTKVKKAIEEATVTATELITAQRALRDQQQDLIVENAKLNQQLEAQRKIAEDTTLSYEERATALKEVGNIQIQLAENVAKQAKAEEDLLNLQIANESNYEKREELETQLAEATAARIEAQTALNTVEQEAGKLGRELDLEELERKRSIRDMLEELGKQDIDNQFEAARAELDLAERTALEELDLLKASEAEKTAAREAFSNKRKVIDEEEANYRTELEKQVADANLAVASQALGAISGLLGEGSKAARAFAIGQTVIDTYVAAQKAFTSQLIPGDPTSPIRGGIAAAAAIVSGLANVRKIAMTKPGDTSAAPSTPQIPAYDPQSSINIPQAGNNIVTPEAPATIKAYVVSSDMTNQQEADKKINDLATL